MMKKVIWFLIILALIGTGVYFIFFNDKDTASEDTNENGTEQTENTNKDEAESSNTPSDVDSLTGFSAEDQSVGAESSAEFNIEKISNTSETGYHEFVFTLSSTQAEAPYVTASYKSNLGVIRIDFAGIGEDNSGIGYQKEVGINKDGITKLYHNVSNDQTEELYDIGVTKSTPFKLTSEQTSEGWTVTVDVQSPGASAETEIDLGSTEFSKTAQSISGVGVDESATISSYAYGISSGVLKFVWNVTSDSTNPIPSVTAEYDSSKNLVVRFTSLSTDRVVTAVNNFGLPSNLILKTVKNENVSEYSFTGLTDIVDYKLSASTSPNQVVLEIKF